MQGYAWRYLIAIPIDYIIIAYNYIYGFSLFADAFAGERRRGSSGFDTDLGMRPDVLPDKLTGLRFEEHGNNAYCALEPGGLLVRFQLGTVQDC